MKPWTLFLDHLYRSKGQGTNGCLDQPVTTFQPQRCFYVFEEASLQVLSTCAVVGCICVTVVNGCSQKQWVGASHSPQWLTDENALVRVFSNVGFIIIMVWRGQHIRKPLPLERYLVTLTDPQRTGHVGWHQVSQEAEEWGGNVGESLYCGFCRKEWARQGTHNLRIS